MKTLKSLFALMLLTTFTIQAAAQSGQDDYDAVATTLNYYLEGGTNNDWSTFKKAFHPTATMKFVGDEGYKEVNALEFFSGMKPGPKQNRETRIANITVQGNIANAILELEYPDATVYDSMNLLKVDGEWKIVNKIFSRNPRIEEKK